MRSLPLALLLLATALPAALAQAGAPALAMGDFWERARGGLVLRETVEGFETVEVGGEPHAAVRLVERSVAVDGAAPQGPVVTAWVRVSDRAFLRAQMEQNGSVRAEEVEAPCVQVRWPLEPGASWTASCRLRVSEGGSERAMEVVIHRSVLRDETRSHPLGLTDVLLLETRQESAEGALLAREWYSPTACGSVRSETYGGGETVVTELLRFRCASGQRPPTPTMVDTCSGVPGARCTPGPAAWEALVVLVLLCAALRGAKRS